MLPLISAAIECKTGERVATWQHAPITPSIAAPHPLITHSLTLYRPPHPRSHIPIERAINIKSPDSPFHKLSEPCKAFLMKLVRRHADIHRKPSLRSAVLRMGALALQQHQLDACTLLASAHPWRLITHRRSSAPRPQLSGTPANRPTAVEALADPWLVSASEAFGS